MDLRNQKGQTMVEYMLLMAVSVSLVITFINSDFIKNTFGSQGSLGKAIKDENQFSYRHAFTPEPNNPTSDIPRNNTEGKGHPSYYQSNGETRFYGPLLGYPQ